MLLKVNREGLEAALASIGAHADSLPIFAHKAEIIPFKLLGVRTPAANIIKQEMLAVGGDAVTPVGAVTCAAKYVDILLLGTLKHYKVLLKKLAQMPYFGIPQAAIDLEMALTPQKLCTTLADGRVLTYEKMCVMGILNVTPDSFYEGSRVPAMEELVERAGRMLAAGAGVLDIGGESTRPGHVQITDEEEIARVVPVIEKLKKEFDVPISIDTYKSAVAEAAVCAGADLVNDIWGLKYDEKMADVIAKHDVACCLMHNRNEAVYDSFLFDFMKDMKECVKIADKAGIARDKIILDPGVGFGKTYEMNLEIIQKLEIMHEFKLPILLGTSRKSVIGLTLDLPADEREEGTLVTTVYAVQKRCAFVRVHDVEKNKRAILMTQALMREHEV